MASKPDDDRALANCDREPVHIPGKIQSFGALIGLDARTERIQYASENASHWLGGLGPTLLGSTLEAAASDRRLTHAIRGAMGLPTLQRQRSYLGDFALPAGPVHAAAFSTGDTIVVEIEPAGRVGASSPIGGAQMVLSAVSASEGLQPALESSVQCLRHLTGHDRVMAYRFLENGDGEVVAEARKPSLESFLGLRYPAWDIPTQVRQVMLRAPFRVIHDVASEPVSIQAIDQAPPLDLSLGHLRGVSPIHIEYLKNMGVESTMNMSIIVRGQLWGLFAFHHYRPRLVPVEVRGLCELLSGLLAMRLQQEEEQDRLQARARLQATLRRIQNDARPPADCVSEHGAELAALLGANGVAWCEGDEVRAIGDAPDAAIVQRLGRRGGEIWSLDQRSEIAALTSDCGTTRQTAGVLHVPIGAEASLCFFRNELLHEIRWAGSKEKLVQRGPHGPRLTPRASFAEYVESVRGRCRPWTRAELDDASEIQQEFTRLSRADSSALGRFWKRRRQQQDLVIAELNHRARNTLALVQSIVRQTAGADESLRSYIEELEARLRALANAHDLLGGSGKTWARMEDLISAELAPFAESSERCTLDGPSLAIRTDLAPTISLVIHELTSNAVKHGALSPNGESLSIRWEECDGGVRILWREKVSTPLEPPRRRGFGLTLIEQAAPSEAGGRASVVFHPDGLQAEVWAPGETVVRDAAPQADVGASGEPQGFKMDDQCSSVLVLDDNVVLAMEMQRLLEGLGAQLVETVSSIADVEASLREIQFDCAILDVDISGQSSLGLARKLRNNGVAVVLVSGYDESYELPAELADSPRLVKPVSKVDLAFAIGRALDSGGSAV